MEFFVSKVAGANLSADGRAATIEFVARSGQRLQLVLDEQDQDEVLKLMESLRERRGEAPEGAALTAAGGWSATYQNVQSVEIGIDASLTTLLLDFDRQERQRIGVAIPLELARKVGQEIRVAAGRALTAASKQKAS